MNQIQSSLKSKARDELCQTHGRFNASGFRKLESIPALLANIPIEHESVFNRSKQRNLLGLELSLGTTFSPIRQPPRLNHLGNLLLGAKLKWPFEFERCCRMGSEHQPMILINKFKDIHHATSSSNRYLQSAFY